MQTPEDLPYNGVIISNSPETFIKSPFGRLLVIDRFVDGYSITAPDGEIIELPVFIAKCPLSKKITFIDFTLENTDRIEIEKAFRYGDETPTLADIREKLKEVYGKEDYSGLSIQSILYKAREINNPATQTDRETRPSDKEPQKRKMRPPEKRIKENEKIREAIKKLSIPNSNIEFQPTAKSIAIETGIKEQTVRDSPVFKKAKDNKQVFVKTNRKAHREINTDKAIAKEYEINKWNDTYSIEPSEAEVVRQLILDQQKEAAKNKELERF